MKHPGFGRTEYAHYCGLLGVPPDAALSPRQRAAVLPAWIGPELVATAPARERLTRWVSDGRAVPTPAVIENRLVFLGDSEIRTIVGRALGRMPPPVTAHVLTGCWFVGGGWSSAGWNASAPPIPGRLAEPLQFIHVSGHDRDPEDVAGIAAHEVAHSWLLAAPTALEELESVGDREGRWRGLMQIAVECGRLDVLLQMATRRERLAAACARAWGFRGPAVDGEFCADGTRHRVALDAAAAAAQAVS